MTTTPDALDLSWTDALHDAVGEDDDQDDALTADQARARIDAHLPILRDALRDAHRFGRTVTGWTLPAAWSPTDVPRERLTTVYGLPTTFTGDRIVLHLHPVPGDEPHRIERTPNP